MDQLSVELVELIFNELDDRSTLAFRAVSRRLCRATYDLFTQRWFATLVTDFTPWTLARLFRISQDRDLASRVRCLRIDIRAAIPRTGAPIPLALTLRLPDDEEDSFKQPCPRRESGSLDLDSPQANRLRDMFLRFTNCTEICVTDGFVSRFWDKPPAGKISPIDICWLMLSLLSGDGRLQLERFEVEFGRNPIEKTDAWPSGPELCAFLSQSSWATHLRQLSISWEFKESLLEIMMPLITSAAQLKSLALRHSGFSENDAFFTQLASAPQVPALTELRLAGCNEVSRAVLTRLIARFQPTLELLWIRYVSVAGGSRGNPEGRIGYVLSQLANMDWPALRCVTVPGCFREFWCPLLFNQEFMDRCGGGFEFTLRNFRSKQRVDCIRYRGHGDDMRFALSAMNNSYKLQRKGPGPETPDFESSPGFRLGRLMKREPI
ncbi:hypothetical protein PG997_000577 [Apiospora hydei]|uniref:F-box domain-containing protein n=1 Tax=Apiospora hydei TaxID=1337664 RepID=A0ABR1XBA6_9PEZI